MNRFVLIVDEEGPHGDGLVEMPHPVETHHAKEELASELTAFAQQFLGMSRDELHAASKRVFTLGRLKLTWEELTSYWSNTGKRFVKLPDILTIDEWFSKEAP